MRLTVLVCGDRDWTDTARLEYELDALGQVGRVVEGEARGADSIAREWALSRGVEVAAFPADWTRFGRAAGPIRNRQMLEEGKPDLVVAFHDDIARSRGTADMVRRARAAGVPVRLFTSDGEVG